MNLSAEEVGPWNVYWKHFYLWIEMGAGSRRVAVQIPSGIISRKTRAIWNNKLEWLRPRWSIEISGNRPVPRPMGNLRITPPFQFISEIKMFYGSPRDQVFDLVRSDLWTIRIESGSTGNRWDSQSKNHLVFCFGALTWGSHPFSFRTRKLSLIVPMVLVRGE